VTTGPQPATTVLAVAVPQHRMHPNQPPIRPASMPANASIGPPALTLGAGVRLTGSPLNARRQPIPHSARGSLGCPISRGFVPCRLSDAGPGACGEAIVAGIRNPAQKPITKTASRAAKQTIGRPSPQRQMKAAPFTTASRRLFKLVQSSPPFKRPAEMKAHVG
jgi:hypothetical protein